MHAKLPEQFLHVRGEQEQFGEQSHKEHKEHSDNLAELFAVLLLAWFSRETWIFKICGF